MENKNNVVPRLKQTPALLLAALGLSLLALILIMVTGPSALVPVYYVTMLAVFLPLLSRHGDKLGRWFAAWPGPAAFRFVLLGFLAVIVEETIVGTIYTLQEGFSFPLWQLRVSQFIAFNVLAFAGPILAACVSATYLKLDARDIFLITGIWGLLAEGIALVFMESALIAVTLILPTMFVYYVIFIPSFLAVGPAGSHGKRWPLWGRVVAPLLLFAIFSIPFGGVLDRLRATNPHWFPSCYYIRC